MEIASSNHKFGPESNFNTARKIGYTSQIITYNFVSNDHTAMNDTRYTTEDFCLDSVGHSSLVQKVYKIGITLSCRKR